MIENVDVNVGSQEVMKETPESPIFIPSLSSPELETPDSCVDTPIQSHANVDLVTFSLLNSNNVARLNVGVSTLLEFNRLNVTRSTLA